MPAIPQQPLCKICSVQHPKYRCPRCQIRTCSLPCAKRHKIWYSCSGQRDPAAYKTKDEITTPAGIDQDYNFLRGLEKVLENADEQHTESGTGDANSHGRGHAQRLHQNGAVLIRRQTLLERALGKSGVKVERAPKGMTQARRNATFFSKKRHCLDWTIEWIFPDETRFLSNSHETATIQAAYKFGRAQWEHMRRGIPRKRRRELSAEEKALEEALQGENDDQPIPQTTHETVADSEISEKPDAQSLLDASIVKSQTLPASDTERDPDPLENPLDLPESLSTTPISTPDPTPSATLHFYIHIPHPTRPSSKPTVSPLTPDLILADALKGRTVLEFPRIYVFCHQAEDAPEGVIIEDKSERKEGTKEGGEEIIGEKEEVLKDGVKREGTRLEDVKKEERRSDVVLKEEEQGLTLLEALRLRVIRSMVK